MKNIGTDIRWRWVSVGVAVVAVAAVTMLAIHRWQVHRISNRLLAEARQFTADGDIEKARKRYSDHLKLMPAGDQPFVEYAQLILADQDTREARLTAMQLFHQAMLAGNNDVRAITQFAETAISLKRFSEAQRILERIPPGETTSDHFQMRGVCLQEFGSAGPAGTAFRKAIALDRNNVDAWNGLLQVTENTDGYKAALKLADSMCEVLPVAGTVAKALLHLNGHQIEEAGRAFYAAAQLDPHAPETVPNLSEYLLRTNPVRSPETDEMAAWCLKHLPKVPLESEYRRAVLLGDLSQRMEQFDAAARYFETCLVHRPTDDFAIGRLAEVLAAAGHTEEAMQQVGRLADRSGNKLLRAILTAKAMQKEGNLTKAIDVLDACQATPGHPNVRRQAHTLLIDLLLQTDRFEEAEVVARHLVRENQDADEARRYLIRALVPQGLYEETLTTLVKLRTPDRSLPGLIPEVVEMVFEAEDIPTFDENARRLVEVYPDTSVVDLIQVAALAHADHTTQAELSLKQLVQSKPSESIYRVCLNSWKRSGILPLNDI